jgi:hypothetical protein
MKEANVWTDDMKKRKTPENRRRKNSAEKTLPLPYFLALFCSLFCRNSAATFPYYLVFSCHNLLPFEVCFAGNIQPTYLVSKLGSKKEFWAENLKTKQRIR